MLMNYMWQEKHLTYLRSDFDNFKVAHQDNEKIARKMVLKKIRCLLVKNPLDFVGRRMAKEAKTVFLRHVLGQSYMFSCLKDGITVPLWIRKKGWIKVWVYLPVIIAFSAITHHLVVYGSDLFSDVRVVIELNDDHDNFRIPHLRNLSNFDQDVEVWASTKLNVGEFKE